MYVATMKWDVRCPQALANLFPERKGYYYKIDRLMAGRIVGLLSAAYDVSTPIISDALPTYGANGECYFKTRKDGHRYSIIRVHGRGHMKTTFHEWYHHLDWVTHGRYNSDDRRGGPTSLAWQFADRMFDVFRTVKAK